MKKILSEITNYIKQKGYTYEQGTVESLYLALKTYPIAIISGGHGCGKTTLARMFAEAIGATSDNGRFKLISVSSEWNSPARLLGYVNLEGKYVPGIMTPFIQSAIADRENNYFVCLDEINLAQPERYMSPILTALKSRRRDCEGVLKTDAIFDKASFGNDISASFGYDGIYFPENLFIIGVCNSGDSAYVPGKKLVDRMACIELVSKDIALDFDVNNIKRKISPSPVGTPEDFLNQDYLKLSDCDSDLEYLCDRSHFWNDISGILKYCSANLSYRTRDYILIYTLYCRKYDIFDADTMVDNLILQKILPRISGFNVYVKNALCDLFRICISKSGENIDDYANSSQKMYQTIINYGSKYSRSAKKIAAMLRGYEEDGYTTFWK